MPTHWALRLIHSLYVVIVSIAAWTQSRKWKPPHPLTAPRNKLPAHLCLTLVGSDNLTREETESAFIQCLQNVAAWCREIGIESLTAYDRDGILAGCSETARERVFAVEEGFEDSCESEVEYPLTPPLSEPSGSRDQSPDRAKLPVDLCVIALKSSSHVSKRRNVAVRRRPKSESCPLSTLASLTKVYPKGLLQRPAT
ncbi:hypothetical protein HYDPIDRAFT_82528 [Hydnomerulius pinastri MD-312]|nr:hypothetical protein HYDPIDRAFT_82528 [Hydnomerulius pinastri MD-312]